MGQHTKDMLADALREIGLTEMADKAATGYYHDFLSPLALPEMQLMKDLADAAENADAERRDPILALRMRAMDGDFDSNAEESDAWAESAEGQEAFRRLSDKLPPVE